MYMIKIIQRDVKYSVVVMKIKRKKNIKGGRVIIHVIFKKQSLSNIDIQQNI